MKKFIKKFLKQKKIFIILEAIATLLLIVSLILLLTGNDNKPEINGEKEVETNNKEEIKEEVSIVDINSKSRPYAVMINNISVARPLQSGLQDAYIIYEIIVEGGITRYLALFLDQDTERIGSIRSARHYFLDYALENDAIYVHHGQSPQAQSDFSALGLDRISVGNKTGWRDKSLNVSSEHTLFTNIEKLNSGLGKMRTERKKDLLFDYSSKEINLNDWENSKVANKVSITYSKATTSSYEYDATEKVYKRFVNGKDHSDYVTKEQYTFKNIITYQLKNTNVSGDNKGRQNLDNIGSGEGYYITNGYATKIKWKKECRECQTEFTYLNGKEIVLNDGNTFIQIQPKGEELKIS